MRPTARGLNTAREEQREGRARVGYKRRVTRPSPPPLGGAAGRAGAGRRGPPRGCVQAAVREVGERAKGRLVEAVEQKGAQRDPWEDARLCLQAGEA